MYVGDHPYFLTFFITFILIDSKITNFSLYSALVSHKIIYAIIFSWLLISRKSNSQYASYLFIFSPLHSVIMESSMKSIFAINPAIMENMECSIFKVCAPVINLKVGVLLDHGVSLCFVLLPALQLLWVVFQAKNYIRSTPASNKSAHRSFHVK